MLEPKIEQLINSVSALNETVKQLEKTLQSIGTPSRPPKITDADNDGASDQKPERVFFKLLFEEG